MRWYVLSYDLRRYPTQSEYDRLHDALRTAYRWCWALQSFWIIGSELLPSQIIQELLNTGSIDDNDGVVILEITRVGNFRRVASQEIVDWMNANLIRA